MSQAKPKPKPKGMSDTEIAARVKKSGSYIHLKPKQVVHVVKQLSPTDQAKCFTGSKTMKALDKTQSAGIVALFGLNGDTPVSKIPLPKRRALIKATMGKNKEVDEYLKDNNLWDSATLDDDKEVAGDFSPSNFWALLDGIVKDIDLSDPDSK